MTPLRGWLATLGLAQYAEGFAAQRIDLGLLPELTDADLKELGIAALGDRKQLLKAIAGRASLPATLSATPSGSRAAKSAPLPSLDGEHRLVSVMFCDLVGSTALSTRLDPEDLREVVAHFHRLVSSIIERFDGLAAQFLGDGVMAFFGWPRAHEDDAERAVRAGLAVIDEVARWRSADATSLEVRSGAAVPLEGRVGIATGAVVVGELGAPDTAQERAAIGETTNLAARLQSLAAPGTLVLDAATQRLAAGAFDYRALGEQRFKGFEQPLPAWQVLGVSGLHDRFAARHAAGLTPIVGRDEELAILERRWQRACEAEGQVVLIGAEPGVGKSRLAAALEQSLEGRAHTRLRYFCSPLFTHSPLHPFVQQLARAAGLIPGEDGDAALARLRALLAQSGEVRPADLALLAELLSVEPGDRLARFDGSPPQKRAATLELLLRQLEAFVARQPVLVLFEDAHWADPSSVELIDLLIDRASTRPLLLLLTHRPEFTPPWVGRAHVAAMTLARLPRREGAKIVERVTGVPSCWKRSSSAPTACRCLSRNSRARCWTPASCASATACSSSARRWPRSPCRRRCRPR